MHRIQAEEEAKQRAYEEEMAAKKREFAEKEKQARIAEATKYLDEAAVAAAIQACADAENEAAAEAAISAALAEDTPAEGAPTLEEMLRRLLVVDKLGSEKAQKAVEAVMQKLMEAEVEAILKDERIKAILDRLGSDPAAMEEGMADEELAPNLKRLIQVGVLRQ
eukprot:SAG22_NODE_6675_length_824_cov_1.191724_1_plen_164_part_10